MQLLFLLGIIIIGSAIGLIYFNTDGKSKDQTKPSNKRGKTYDTSDDGKVIYIFDKSGKERKSAEDGKKTEDSSVDPLDSDKPEGDNK